MSQPFYTIQDVAKLLDVHHRTVRAWIEEGKLRAIRVGRLFRIPSEALDEFTSANKRETATSGVDLEQGLAELQGLLGKAAKVAEGLNEKLAEAV